MGMAGFGQPRLADEIMTWFTLHDDGTFVLDQAPFEFLAPKDNDPNPLAKYLRADPHAPGVLAFLSADEPTAFFWAASALASACCATSGLISSALRARAV